MVLRDEDIINIMFYPSWPSPIDLGIWVINVT